MENPPKATPRDWLYLIRAHPRGAEWAASFAAPHPARLTGEILEALLLLRRREGPASADSAAAILHRVAGELRTPSDAALPSSASWVLWRWFHPAWAYWRYLVDDLDGAETYLALAEEALCRAIELDGFLVPLAVHCGDFSIQRVRIARNRGDWGELDRRIERAAAMVANRAPLCTLKDGTAITFETVADHCAGLPALDAAEVAAVRDTRALQKGVAEFTAQILAQRPGS